MGSKSGVDGTIDVSVVGAALAAGSVGNGVTDATTTRVTLSSDSTGQVKATNLPATVDTNAGAAGASTPRAVLSNDGQSVVSILPYPSGATPLGATSANVANSIAQACLSGASGKTTYVTGFQITAAGATAALVVNATLAALTTHYFTFVFPAGVTTPATPLTVAFPTPIPAPAPNTAICVTLPAGGAGNTNATVNIQGFRL